MLLRSFRGEGQYHVSRLGRLSSPDPIAGSTANPQSLNRYSYSINDPANVTDPSGATTDCNTVQARPKNKTEQAAGVGPSDTDNSDGDASDAEADPPQQAGCGSHVNPFGGSGDPMADWDAALGVGGAGTIDGGVPIADAPPGMFTVTSIGGTPAGVGNWIWLPSDTVRDLQQDPGQDKPQSLSSWSDPGRWLDLGALGVPSAPGDSGDGLMPSGIGFGNTAPAPQFHLSIPLQRLQKPSCASVALGETFNELTSPLGLPGFPAGQGPDDAAKAVAQAAASHVIEGGLTYPLRSSIVRGLLQGGESVAQVIVIAPLFYAMGKGLIAEYQSNKAGTCSTTF